jgi:RNA polymerase sigma-70 factor (family 1)
MNDAFSEKSVFFNSIDERKDFSQLVEINTSFLLQTAMNLLKNKELAEEVVNDVFISIWENRYRLTEIQNLKAYLRRCVKNACINQLRASRSGNHISIDSFEEFPYSETNSHSEHLDAAQQIHDAINQLPPRCRLAFSLVKVNGMRYSEVAIIMNISEKTVNNHLVFAVKKIKESLGVNAREPQELKLSKERRK